MARNTHSQAGSGGAVHVKKPVVTIKVELPVMSSAKAYERALKIAEKLDESEGSPYRVKAISVTA